MRAAQVLAVLPVEGGCVAARLAGGRVELLSPCLSAALAVPRHQRALHPEAVAVPGEEAAKHAHGLFLMKLIVPLVSRIANRTSDRCAIC